MATVLLVEDDPGAAQGLRLALNALGCGVRPASSGEAALDTFREKTADVVVLDVMLPGLDGFEADRNHLPLKRLITYAINARSHRLRSLFILQPSHKPMKSWLQTTLKVTALTKAPRLPAPEPVC